MFNFRDCNCESCKHCEMTKVKTTKRTGVSKTRMEQKEEYARNREEAARMEEEGSEDDDYESMNRLRRPRRSTSQTTQIVDSSSSDEDTSNSQKLSDEEDDKSGFQSHSDSVSSRISQTSANGSRKEKRKVKRADGKTVQRRPHGASPTRRFWCPAEECGYHGEQGNLNRHLQKVHPLMNTSATVLKRLDEDSLKNWEGQKKLERQMAEMEKASAKFKATLLSSKMAPPSTGTKSVVNMNRKVVDLVADDLRCSTTECSDNDTEIVSKRNQTVENIIHANICDTSCPPSRGENTEAASGSQRDHPKYCHSDGPVAMEMTGEKDEVPVSTMTSVATEGMPRQWTYSLHGIE